MLGGSPTCDAVRHGYEHAGTLAGTSVETSWASLIGARRPTATADDFDPAADTRDVRRVVFHLEHCVTGVTMDGDDAAFVCRGDVFGASKDAPSKAVRRHRFGSVSGGYDARAALV